MYKLCIHLKLSHILGACWLHATCTRPLCVCTTWVSYVPSPSFSNTVFHQHIYIYICSCALEFRLQGWFSVWCVCRFQASLVTQTAIITTRMQAVLQARVTCHVMFSLWQIRREFQLQLATSHLAVGTRTNCLFFTQEWTALWDLAKENFHWEVSLLCNMVLCSPTACPHFHSQTTLEYRQNSPLGGR